MATTGRSQDAVDGGGSTTETAPSKMEVIFSIEIGNGDQELVQAKLETVLKLKLGNANFVAHATVESFWRLLTDMGRRVIRIFRGSVVCVVECPTWDSRQGLQNLCGASGRLVQAAERICRDCPQVLQSNTSDVKVSVLFKEVSADTASKIPAQQPAPGPGPVPAQAPPDSLKEQCDRIKEEMVAEFSDENPRLLGPGGLGGTGVNVMMAAYLTKWKILEPIDLQEVQNEMLIKAKRAAKLLELLTPRSPKHFVMFARALQKIGMKHQLNCLEEKKENGWIFKNTDEEMYARLNSIYPDKGS